MCYRMKKTPFRSQDIILLLTHARMRIKIANRVHIRKKCLEQPASERSHLSAVGLDIYELQICLFNTAKTITVTVLLSLLVVDKISKCNILLLRSTTGNDLTLHVMPVIYNFFHIQKMKINLDPYEQP